MRRLPLSTPIYLLAIAALVSARPAAAAPAFDYLYVEANEGGSSGGHVAVRLDDAVYHFQHYAPGLIRLQRDDARRFLDSYGRLQNRTIHASRIAVSDDTAALLRDHFNRLFLVQEQQFDGLAALDDEVRLLRALRERARGGNAALRLRGAGFFFDVIETVSPHPASSEEAQSAPGGVSSREAVEPLRARIVEAYGPDAVEQRAEELFAELLALVPDGRDSTGVRLAETSLPDRAPAFSERYRDLVLGMLALRVLATAPPLQPSAVHRTEDPALRLGAGELAALAAFSDQLTRDLAPLMRSPRPDWGFALLVGMARLAALHETARTGSLVLLDSFPPEHDVVDHADLAAHGDVLGGLLTEARDELRSARAALLASSPVDEASFADLEAAGNRFLELWNAAYGGGNLRLARGPLVPSREATVTDLVSAPMTPAELDTAVDRALRRRDEYGAQLEHLYGYQLIRKNCVSEIFRQINAALEPARGSESSPPALAREGPIRAASRARLGGYIEPGQSMSFIPFVSATAVRTAYHVAQSRDLPSYRSRSLEEMYGRENKVVVFLRESNTVTSSIYHHNSHDSYFVFFTDDTVATRPIFGTVNFLAGVGAGAAGLALLPFDRGLTFVRGLRGALFSLPELAFFNIRKGTFEYLPGDGTEPPQNR